MAWICLVQNRKEWRAFVQSVMSLKVSLKCKQLYDSISNYQVLDSATSNVPPLAHTNSCLGGVNSAQVQYNFTVACVPHTPVNQMLPRSSNILHYAR
jgi:hypothetical protein